MKLLLKTREIYSDYASGLGWYDNVMIATVVNNLLRLKEGFAQSEIGMDQSA